MKIKSTPDSGGQSEGVFNKIVCCFIGSVRHIEVAKAWNQITNQFSFPKTRFFIKQFPKQ